MRREMKSHSIVTIESVYSYALDIFSNDRDKTNIWWVTPNDFLDGKSPYQITKEGKGKKLLSIMQESGL